MINRCAILHKPLSEYAFMNSETSLTIRLRAALNNLQKCTLYYADRMQPSEPLLFTAVPMELAHSDLYFSYFEATFASLHRRVCYYFLLDSGDEQLIFYDGNFYKELATDRRELYQFPYLRREEVSTVPEWFKHAVVYNIFPDSFASSKANLHVQATELADERTGQVLHTRLGGNLRGIIENIDYIKSLGFNCLYLNPIFTAAEYHRYDLLDYFHVSPNLGIDAEFKELVVALHARDMHIIIDGVFNHSSWYFFAFNDVVENGENSRYKDWYYDLKFPVKRPENGEKPSYASFAYEPKMPKLNTSNPEVRDYFLRVCAYWLEEFDVDGWRLDVANEVDKAFWQAFKNRARSVKQDAVLIGEIWESSERWLQGDMFDSVMNYAFRNHCRDFFAFGKFNPTEFDARISQMLMRYPTGIQLGQLNLLDSHDAPRFLSYCDLDLRKWRQAEAYIFTSPGVPCVFYGDELGVFGYEELDFRKAMPWQNVYFDECDFIKQLADLRKEQVVIYGNYRTLLVTDNLYAFKRELGEEKLVVIFNLSETEIDLRQYPKFDNLNLLNKEATLAKAYVKATARLGARGFAAFLLK